MKLLLLDNYDSFTYNLWDYLMQQQGVSEVQVWRNDQCSLDDIAAGGFAALVLSPGPKRPADAGLLMQLVERFYQQLPILGICLGHQALGEFFGAQLLRAKLPVHGKTDKIRHSAQGIFEGLPQPLQVMRYHSLILENLPDCLENIAQTEEGECMAIRHKSLPLWGLQFHPESILTPQGLDLLANWCAGLGN